MNDKKATDILKTVRMIPYPKVVGVEKDSFFANKLYDDYACDNGEFGAISLYVYQHIALEDKDLSKTLLDIAEIEMHHLDIIGTLIKQSGKVPYYKNSKGQFWDGSFVNYKIHPIKEMLEYNMKEEQMAAMRYLELKQYTNNETIKAMLDRIVIDETSHLEIFTGYLENY